MEPMEEYLNEKGFIVNEETKGRGKLYNNYFLPNTTNWIDSDFDELEIGLLWEGHLINSGQMYLSPLFQFWLDMYFEEREAVNESDS